MTLTRAPAAAIALLACGLAVPLSAQGQPGSSDSFTWRYYRVGNTGIQGDYNEALWVAPDGDPYIGGYDPIFEEGGFSKYVQAEDRWINYSNVDYPVIGHPNDLGTTRVTDIVPETSGQLWLGTWRGAIRFDPAVGAASLARFGPATSALTNDFVSDIDRAPDGTIWFANNGSVRYDPATGSWTRWSAGNSFLSVQPKPSGGYLVWSSSRQPTQDYTFVFDSDTQQWTTITVLPQQAQPGDVVGMPGKDCVDESGNFWALRATQPGQYASLDYRKPDGTWIRPPEPYAAVTFDLWAFTAYGDGRAILVDGGSNVYQFNGSAWVSLGAWKTGAYTEAADVDPAGNVWVSGVGGAARRSAATGQWQRFRITNTGNFDDFNRDLTIDAVHGQVYTGANAAPGVGGMVRFDGQRWTGWDQLIYGQGYDWPFPNDSCQALAYRPSSGRVAVSPLNWLYGIHEWTGSAFQPLLASGGAERMCEDSLGRLWNLGEYFNLSYLSGGTWTPVPIVGWGYQIRRDPTLPGTVWTLTGYQFMRTDGVTSFARDISDFPELTTQSDTFSGIAVDQGGVAWVGCSVHLGIGGTGGGLIRIDADTGDYEMLRYDQGWPFPGNVVTPWAVTPDGRLWLQYDDTLWPYDNVGLCWWDGTHVGAFPAPPDGGPQWGGLPHKQIEDLEVRPLSDGYELWMSCVSRGLAVLTVKTASGGPTWADLGSGLPGVGGIPALAGTGTLAAGSPCSLALTNANPSAAALLFASLSSAPLPFKGGTLLAYPFVLTVGLGTSAGGAITLPFTWPSGVPTGTALYIQIAVQDAVAPFGVALSNGLKGVTP